MPHAGGSRSRLPQDKRAKDGGTQEGKAFEGLKDLSTTDLCRNIMDPDPESILDPPGIRGRECGDSSLDGFGESTISFPQNEWVFDSLDQIR
jgi:hypothetical protein